MRYPVEDDQPLFDKRLIFHGQCLYRYTGGLLQVRCSGGGGAEGRGGDSRAVSQALYKGAWSKVLR